MILEIRSYVAIISFASAHPKTRFPKAPRPLAGWFGGAEPLHEAPTNQTISPRKNPSAGSGTHFRGKSDRLIGATE
jgi:hypothetical protein